jgi:hypothetical protein
MKEENSHRSQNEYIRVAYNTESSLRYCQRRSYFVTQCHTHTSADILEHEAPASTVAPTNSHTKISKGTVALSAVAPMITNKDFHRHRGFERRGSEHRCFNEFTHNPRVATRANLQSIRRAYPLSSNSLSHLPNFSSPLSPIPISPETIADRSRRALLFYNFPN